MKVRYAKHHARTNTDGSYLVASGQGSGTKHRSSVSSSQALGVDYGCDVSDVSAGYVDLLQDKVETECGRVVIEHNATAERDRHLAQARRELISAQRLQTEREKQLHQLLKQKTSAEQEQNDTELTLGELRTVLDDLDEEIAHQSDTLKRLRNGEAVECALHDLEVAKSLQDQVAMESKYAADGAAEFRWRAREMDSRLTPKAGTPSYFLRREDAPEKEDKSLTEDIEELRGLYLAKNELLVLKQQRNAVHVQNRRLQQKLKFQDPNFEHT